MEIEIVDGKADIFWWQRCDARRNSPCLFLDRDGVVIEEVGYLHRTADVRVIAGARETIEAARARNWAVGLVTNQAGIGRGYYDWHDFIAVQAAICRALELGAEPFDFVAGCAAHSEAVVEHLRMPRHPWRKPLPGMLNKAKDALGFDLARSVFVGDNVTDMEAGLMAGVGTLVHVRTGHGAKFETAVAALAAERAVSVAWADSIADLPAILDWTQRT